MEIKVLTTNIWRYYKWNKRKNVLIRFLKEKNADIVFIQEAAYDERLKNKWSNQVEEINYELGYKDSIFEKLMKMSKWHEKSIDWIMYYGFGMLSKYPIKKTELIVLPSVKKNKKFGFLHMVIKTPKKDLDLINVHFENTDEGSKEHLKQTIEWCKNKKIKPIIAGDFNVKTIENLKKLVEREYHISYIIKPYKSFMPTRFSHNESPITLDYIIAHKDQFEMKDVKCFNNSVSDHNPVIATLTLKPSG